MRCRQDDVVYAGFKSRADANRAYDQAVKGLEGATTCPGTQARSWKQGKVSCGRSKQGGEPALIWTQAGKMAVVAVYAPLAQRLGDLVPGWSQRRLRRSA